MKAYTKYFFKATKDNFPGKANEIIVELIRHFESVSSDTKFAKTSENLIDKRLEFCAWFLALIKTLDEQGETFQTIRKVCLEVVTAYVTPKNKFHAFLKQIPPKLIHTWLGQKLLIYFNKRVSHNSNSDGFLARIITDPVQTFGFGYGVDILECGICKLFKKHNYQKYSSILCEVDEITSSLAGLKLIRTGTIANGATKCDFRFVKAV